MHISALFSSLLGSPPLPLVGVGVGLGLGVVLLLSLFGEVEFVGEVEALVFEGVEFATGCGSNGFQLLMGVTIVVLANVVGDALLSSLICP